MSHPFAYHVFVCTHQKLEDKAYCTDQGGEEVRAELERQLSKLGLEDRVEVTPCSCLGLCQRGPVMVVYPEGTWYVTVRVEDVEQIVQSHFLRGAPVERLRPRPRETEQLRREIRTEKDRARRLQAAHEEAGVVSERLRRLAGDFQASRALLSAVDLDLFTAVGDGATAAQVAEKIGTDPRATEMLLNALTAIGLLTKTAKSYFNTEDTGRYLQRGLPDDSRAALMHRVHMWDSWSTLSDCVREGSALRYDHNAGPSATQAYIAATHRIAKVAAPGLVATLELPAVHRVLDVGAGSGAHTAAVLKAFPAATAVLMDLPPVIRIATRYMREAGLEDRITLRGGDFTLDPLGSGFDLVLLSYVMHLNPPEINQRLLAKVFDALEPGGRVVINDYVLNAEKTLPRAAALHALNMLVTTHGGTVYAFDEFSTWLGGAGFTEVKRISVLGPTDVVTAVRPKQAETV